MLNDLRGNLGDGFLLKKGCFIVFFCPNEIRGLLRCVNVNEKKNTPIFEKFRKMEILSKIRKG